MTDKFEKVKSEVKIADVVEDFGIKLNYHDKGLCPFHQEKTPSFSVDRKTNIFTCFGCGETGDVVSFVCKMKECEPIEAVKYLAEKYSVDIGEDTPKSPKISVADYIKRCLADISKTDYFEKRGLEKSTIRRFLLGYDVARKSVVIPYSSKMGYYQTRGTEEKTFYKPRTEEAGAEPLFNIGAMTLKNNEPIFVVESPICAMSIVQGYADCGLDSGYLKEALDDTEKKKNK